MATRPPRRTISVNGTRKSVVVDLLAPRVEMTAGEGTEQVDFAGYRRNQMFLDEADHFLACVEGKAEPAIPLDEGIAVLRLALEVKDAIA
jgi:predicted dehydrogenase